MEFNFKQYEELFNLNPVIDQAEKTVASMLTFVPHVELKDTLVNLNKASANFARANFVATKNLGSIVKTFAEDAQKNIKTAVNAK